jgi:hypothetical protein
VGKEEGKGVKRRERGKRERGERGKLTVSEKNLA